MPDFKRWIPASTGMTAKAQTIDVSAAPAFMGGERRWIPAFAGMTATAQAIDVFTAPAYRGGDADGFPLPWE